MVFFCIKFSKATTLSKLFWTHTLPSVYWTRGSLKKIRLNHSVSYRPVYFFKPPEYAMFFIKYCDVIMGAMASQITILTIVCSAVYSKRWSKKTLKLRVTGLCAGNSPVTGEILAQKASNAESVSIWWCHHVCFLVYGVNIVSAICSRVLRRAYCSIRMESAWPIAVHEDLTHWGRDKIAAIFPTTFWIAFSWIKMY